METGSEARVDAVEDLDPLRAHSATDQIGDPSSGRRPAAGIVPLGGVNAEPARELGLESWFDRAESPDKGPPPA